MIDLIFAVVMGITLIGVIVGEIVMARARRR